MSKVFNILHWLRKWYWKTFDIKTFGVRVILKKGDEFFLGKHRYGNYWVFPGGGIKKNESFEDAAIRETREECNIHIKSFERVLGTYKNTTGGKNDTVTVLVAEEWIDNGKKWSLELKESGFFHFGDLPKDTSPATRKRIEEYMSGDSKDFSGKW